MHRRVQLIQILNRIGVRHQITDSAKIPANRGKRHAIFSWFKRAFREFADNTVLHGYNHIVDDNASKYERYKKKKWNWQCPVLLNALKTFKSRRVN